MPNYTYRWTLFEVLNKVSPQIIKSLTKDEEKDFTRFLNTHVLVTNYRVLSKALDDPKGIANFDSQKELIAKFILESKKVPLDGFSYLPLFWRLIGADISKLVDEFGTIFFVDASSGSLILIAGAPFYYKPFKKKQHLLTFKHCLVSQATLDPTLRSFMDTLAGKDDAEKRILDEFEAYEGNIFKYNKKVIIRNDLLYSRMSFGKVNIPKFSLANDKLTVAEMIKEVTERFESEIKAKDKPKVKPQTKPFKLEKAFKEIQRKYAGVRVDNLLKKHCPLPSCYKNPQNNLEALLKGHTTHKELFSFIYALYYAIFPVKIFGSKANHRVFFGNLKVLFTASLVAKFRVFDLLDGLDLSQMSLLFDDLPFYVPNEKVEVSFLLWIFNCLKVIVRSVFYITEASGQNKNSLFYYRFDLWEKMKKLGIKDLSEMNQWTLMENKNSSDLCTNMSDYLRHSDLRLIPKKNGFRPLLSLKFYDKAPPGAADYKKVLGVCLGLLKRARRSSAFDAQNGSKSMIYERLLQLKSGGEGPFYVVRGDFENCYPSINLGKLMKLILAIPPISQSQANERKLLLEHVVLFRQTSSNFYSRKSEFLLKPADYRKSSLFRANDDYGRLIKLLMSQLSLRSLEGHVVSFSGQSETLDLSVVLEVIKVYLSSAEVRFGKKTKYKLTSKGVRQGAPLSSELTDIYLTAYLTHVFSELFSPPLEPVVSGSHFFLRIADDFLFVSRSLEQARHFAIAVARPSKEAEDSWGLKVNSCKFVTNFNLVEDLEDEAMEETFEDIKVAFFGRKICSSDLSVSLDLDSLKDNRLTDSYSCNPFGPLLPMLKSVSGEF